MKKSHSKVLTVIAGVLLAICILLSNVFQSSAANNTTDLKAKTEQSGDIPSFSVHTLTIAPPSSISIETDHFIQCLFEIDFNQEVIQAYPVDISFSPQRFLTTLFQVIISPNAP